MAHIDARDGRLDLLLVAQSREGIAIHVSVDLDVPVVTSYHKVELRVQIVLIHLLLKVNLVELAEFYEAYWSAITTLNLARFQTPHHLGLVSHEFDYSYTAIRKAVTNYGALSVRELGTH